MRSAPVSSGPPRLRPSWAVVDLDAIAHNVAYLKDRAAPAQMCAAVKADGYGHGLLPTARAALAGGASWLGVALVEEGIQLREAGIDTPVLVLSEPPTAAMPELVAYKMTPAIYTPGGVAALAKAAQAAGSGVTARAAGSGATARAARRRPYPLHLKVDTGMHRVGALPADALALAKEIHRSEDLELEGFFTHFAVADELDSSYTAGQMEAYQGLLDKLAAEGIEPRLRHASNSAGTMWHHKDPFNMVRCGISCYGLAPGAEVLDHPDVAGLRPALSLYSRVSFVKELEAGEGISYGLRYRLPERSVLATVPIGYGDGIPRRYGLAGGQVLIGGRRQPIVGTVTMDQMVVNCGPGADVAIGDDVVLIGEQGRAEISAWEWAVKMETIAYEVTCGLTARVPRVHVGLGADLP